jgi:hypothetical protein
MAGGKVVCLGAQALRKIIRISRHGNEARTLCVFIFITKTEISLYLEMGTYF